MSDHKNYRLLQAGEIVQEGDEYDKPLPGEGYGWLAKTEWAPVPECSIGRAAADPCYPAHTKFRRKISQPANPNTLAGESGGLEAKVGQPQSKIDRLTTQDIDDEPQFIYPEQTP